MLNVVVMIFVVLNVVVLIIILVVVLANVVLNVVVLIVVVPNVIAPIAVVLNVVVPLAILLQRNGMANAKCLIVIFTDCCTECLYAKCRYAKCRCTDCCCTKCHCTDCCCTECRCTIGHFASTKWHGKCKVSLKRVSLADRKRRKREREIHKQFCLSVSCPSFLTLSQMHSLKLHQKHSLSLSLSRFITVDAKTR